MKKTISKTKHILRTLGMIFLGCFSMIGVSGCSSATENSFDSLSDFKNKKIALWIGCAYAELLDDCDQIGNGNYTSITYNTLTDCIHAVINGRADALVTDEPVARTIVAKYSDLACFEQYLATDKYATLFSKKSELYDPICNVIDDYIADGTIEKLKNEWVYQLGGEPSISPLTTYNPDYDPSKTNVTLKIGGLGMQSPMCYLGDDGVILGLEVELYYMVAAKLNYAIEIDANYNSVKSLLFPLENGKIDIAIGGISYTEERAQSFNYSPIYYDGGAVFVYKKGNQLYKTLEDIDGKNIGCLVGSSVYKECLKDKLPNTYNNDKIYYYSTIAHCKAALESGYIEGYVDEYPSAKYYENIRGKTKILDSISTYMDYGFLYANNSQGDLLKNLLETYIAYLKTESEDNLTSLYNSWINSTAKYGPLDKSNYPSDETGGTFKVGVYCEAPPISYLADDLTNTGFEIELLYKFASYYNLKLEIINYPFGSILSSLEAENVDMVVGSIILNEERKSKFPSTIYTRAQIALVVKKTSKTGNSIFDDFADNFYSNFIKGNRYLFILEGLGITIVVTIFSIILASILGALLCWTRMRKNRFVSGLSKGVIAFIEGIPVLLLLLFFYHIVFGGLDISSVLISIIAFSIGFMPYYAEVFRSSIQSVPKGQIEAAKATGFNKRQIIDKVIFPQALKVALPVYLGECVSSLKMTSIVGYIGLMDLTRASDLIQSLTFDAFLPLLAVSLIYLLLSLGLNYLFKLFSKLICKKDFTKKKLRMEDNLFDIRRRKRNRYIESPYDGDVAISIKNLTKTFDDNITVLKDLSVDIYKNNIVSIIGPSGTGKSTLIRCINDLEPLTTGEIIVNGRSNIDRNKISNIYKNDVQMVFQSFNLWSHLSVIENIVLGPIYINCMPRDEAYKLAFELLDKVGLRSKAYAYPDEISGGQQQRVSIARALAMKPKVLLFDEPTSALDPTMIGEVLNVIKSLAKQRDLTMLIVTHEMKFAKDVSNRVFFMEEKGIYEDGTPKEIFENPKKELTINFVNRIHKFERDISIYEFDYPKLANDISIFLHNYIIDEKFINKGILAVEEILLHSLFEKSTFMKLSIQHSERKEAIMVKFEFDGNYNPFESFDDDVSKTIFDASVSEKDYLENVITFLIKD